MTYLFSIWCRRSTGTKIHSCQLYDGQPEFNPGPGWLRIYAETKQGKTHPWWSGDPRLVDLFTTEAV
jgi:hypothetical protein